MGELTLPTHFSRSASGYPDGCFQGPTAICGSEAAVKVNPIHQVVRDQKIQLMQLVRRLLRSIVDIPEANRLTHVLMMLLDGATLTTQMLGRKTSALEAWAAAEGMLFIVISRATD